MKKLFLKIGLLISACLLCFVFAELFLRFFLPIPLKPPVRQAYTQTIPGLKENIVYDRNEFGLRSLSMTKKEKPENTIRIICLGASTTDQPTQNTEDIWSGILETELNKKYEKQGIRFEVAAYGRGGGVVLNRLDWAAKNLMHLKPDLVILLEGINDLCLNGGSEYTYTNLPSRMRMYAVVRSYKEKLFGDPDEGDQDSWFFECREQIQLCRRINVLKLRLQFFLAKRSGKILEWHSQYLAQRQKTYQECMDVGDQVNRVDPFQEFSDGIGAILSALKHEKIPVLVMSQPTKWKEKMTETEYNTLWFAVHSLDGEVRPGLPWLVREMDRYNAVQKEIALKMGVRFFDLAGAIPKNSEMIFDDCHFTDKGNKVVADAIIPEVQSIIDELGI